MWSQCAWLPVGETLFFIGVDVALGPFACWCSSEMSASGPTDVNGENEFDMVTGDMESMKLLAKFGKPHEQHIHDASGLFSGYTFVLLYPTLTTFHLHNVTK